MNAELPYWYQQLKCQNLQMKDHHKPEWQLHPHLIIIDYQIITNLVQASGVVKGGPGGTCAHPILSVYSTQ